MALPVQPEHFFMDEIIPCPQILCLTCNAPCSVSSGTACCNRSSTSGCSRSCGSWRHVLHESQQFEVRKQSQACDSPTVVWYRSRPRETSKEQE